MSIVSHGPCAVFPVPEGVAPAAWVAAVVSTVAVIVTLLAVAAWQHVTHHRHVTDVGGGEDW